MVVACGEESEILKREIVERESRSEMRESTLFFFIVWVFWEEKMLDLHV